MLDGSWRLPHQLTSRIRLRTALHLLLRVGDTVVVNGWGIGTDHWGGYAGQASIRSIFLLNFAIS